MSDVSTGAREAIRIAEKFFPNHLGRQKELAEQIIGAINLCEAEFATEIVKRMRAAASTHQ